MLRAFLFLLAFIPLTAAVSTSAMISTLFDPTGRLYHRHAVVWARMALWLAGTTVEVEGAEKVPLHEPVIFMSNHQSNFDILALFCAIPRQFAWIAKEELFRIPIFGHSMGRAGYVPLDRGDGRRALKSMEKAAAMIRSGKSVVIFPEGTRTTDGSLLPFKRGGFLVAGKAGVPIVPVTVTGSLAINPPKRMELHRGRIRVRFSDAIPVPGAAGTNRDGLMEQVRQQIAARLEN